MLPEPVVNEEVPRLTASSGKYMIAGGYHQDGTAKNGILGDQPMVISMIRIEVRQNRRQRRHVLEEAARHQRDINSEDRKPTSQ